MKVKDLMELNTLIVNIDTPLIDITLQLLNDSVECILVANNNDDITGIITLSDIFRFIFPNYNEIREHTEYVLDTFAIKLRTDALDNMLAKNIMSKFPEVVKKDDSVIAAAAVMKDFKIKHLPVMENGKPIGIITGKNILRNIVQETSEKWISY